MNITLECQIAWIQIPPDDLSCQNAEPELGPNCLQRSSAGEKKTPLADKAWINSYAALLDKKGKVK